MRSAKKTLVVIVLGIVLFALLLPVVWHVLFRVTYGNWNKRFATLEHNSTQVIVHGYTESPLNGWNVSLLWKKETGKWSIFYLNHDAYFDVYSLQWRDSHILVFCKDSLIGDLDTDTGKFFHLGQNVMYERPIDTIHDVHLDDYQQWERLR